VGSLNILFLVNPERIGRVEDNRIVLKSGKILDLGNFRGLLSFGHVPDLARVNLPAVSVSERGLMFFNLHVRGDPPDLGKLLDSVLHTVEVLSGDVLRSLRVRDLETLLAWLSIESLLFNTLCGFMTLLLSEEGFRTDPSLTRNGLPLWKVLFLPTATYTVLKEVLKTVRFEVPKIEDPPTALNTVLSYILGDPETPRVLLMNRDLLVKQGVIGGSRPVGREPSPSRSPLSSFSLRPQTHRTWRGRSTI
jgi:hypothetical protein